MSATAGCEEVRARSWTWLVVASGFLALAVTMGVRSAFGVYVLPWQQEFGVSRAQVSAISSLSLLTYGLGNLVAGHVAERVGIGVVLPVSLSLVALGLFSATLLREFWALLLSYGVIASAGFSGASHVTASVAIRATFPEGRRAFALSLAVAGMGVGQLVLVPMQVLVGTAWGWRSALRILALGAALLGLLARLVLAPVPSGGARAVRTAESSGNPKGPGLLFRDPCFWVFLFPYFVCGFTDTGLADNHFVPLAQGRGVPGPVLAGALALLAAANLLGTVGLGYLADRLGRATVLAGMYGLRAVAFLFTLAGGPWMVWLFAVAYGATYTATIAPTNALALALFARSSPGLAVGTSSFLHQVGAALGALWGGWVFDRTGDYPLAFATAAVLLVLSALVMAGLRGRAKQDVGCGGS